MFEITRVVIYIQKNVEFKRKQNVVEIKISQEACLVKINSKVPPFGYSSSCICLSV